MYSKHIIIGNLGGDPEMRYTPQGQAVCNFSVAVGRKWTSADGQSHEETTWYRVATWGKLAEHCSQYLKKGRTVLVESERLKVDAYLNREGQAAAKLEMTAVTVKFLSAREGSAPATGGGAWTNVDPSANEGGQASEDYIPF